jgi:hypothetical protein
MTVVLRHCMIFPEAMHEIFVFGAKQGISILSSYWMLVRPPLWSSESSWLQIQRPGFDFQRYQIFWVVVGLERGSFSLVSTIEELLERKSGSGLKNRGYGRRDPSRWPCGALYPKKLALTSPTSGSRSVDVVRSRTQATEFVFVSLDVCSRRKLDYNTEVDRTEMCEIAEWIRLAFDWVRYNTYV